MKPINDWIIVETQDPPEVSAGGIVLPKKKNESIKESIVIAISEDIGRIIEVDPERSPLQFKEGDTVYHHIQTGIALDPNDVENKKFLMKFDAVMCVKGQVEEAAPDNVVPIGSKE